MSADDFAHAVQFVWQLPPENDGNGVKVSNETKLKLYGLYKQATEGDCDLAKPSFFSGFATRAKWNAWDANRCMSSQQAKELYVATIDELTAGEWRNKLPNDEQLHSPDSAGENVTVSRHTDTSFHTAYSGPDSGMNQQSRHAASCGDDFDTILEDLNTLLQEDDERLSSIEAKLTNGKPNESQASATPYPSGGADKLTPSQQATIDAGKQLATFCRLLYHHTQLLHRRRGRQESQVENSTTEESTSSLTTMVKQCLLSIKMCIFVWISRLLSKLQIFHEKPAQGTILVLSFLFILLWIIQRLRHLIS